MLEYAAALAVGDDETHARVGFTLACALLVCLLTEYSKYSQQNVVSDFKGIIGREGHFSAKRRPCEACLQQCYIGQSQDGEVGLLMR